MGGAASAKGEAEEPTSSRVRLGAIVLKKMALPRQVEEVRAPAGDPRAAGDEDEEDVPPSGTVRAPAHTLDVEDDPILVIETVPPPPSMTTDIERISASMRAATSGGRGGIAAIAAHEICRAARARGVLVQLYDERTDTICTIGAAGGEAKEQLGVDASAKTDFLAAHLRREGRSMTLCFEGDVLPSFAPRRLAEMGAQRSVVAVPARHGGTFVGMIEVVDAAEHLGSVAETSECVAVELAALLASS